ncbi:MAG TPA: hypothetical protein VIM14_17180 [Polyangia bacterium]
MTHFISENRARRAGGMGKWQGALMVLVHAEMARRSCTPDCTIGSTYP